jgi:GNAT superfamily N-acetyltransferase
MIRQAAFEDAPHIARFNCAMALETEGVVLDVATAEAGVHAVIEDLTKGFYLVAQMEDEYVGSAMVTYEWSDWHNAMRWWLQSLYVSSEYRGKGVATALYEAVKVRAKAEGILGLRLYVYHSNETAMQLYRRWGMQEIQFRLFDQKL